MELYFYIYFYAMSQLKLIFINLQTYPNIFQYVICSNFFECWDFNFRVLIFFKTNHSETSLNWRYPRFKGFYENKGELVSFVVYLFSSIFYRNILPMIHELYFRTPLMYIIYSKHNLFLLFLFFFISLYISVY